jgi:hypothetical protein
VSRRGRRNRHRGELELAVAPLRDRNDHLWEERAALLNTELALVVELNRHRDRAAVALAALHRIARAIADAGAIARTALRELAERADLQPPDGTGANVPDAPPARTAAPNVTDPMKRPAGCACNWREVGYAACPVHDLDGGGP